MKKLFTLLFTFALFAILMAGSANAQVTVTNPGNTTPNLAATYTTLALALTDLNNVTAMTGPVTLTLTSGYSETTPPTGLVIGSATLNPVLSATNSVLINTTGIVTLNAGVGTATPGSAAPDGILAILGADYITIDGLTFTDGNTTNPATMEFGVGLFKLSASDGAQNNTIQNCTFNMQRVNNAAGTLPMVEGSVGIRVVNATNTAATTTLTPLSAAGTNSYNKFYTNIINSGNYGISIYGYADVTPFTLGDTGNDIGGSSPGQGNQILNFGGGGVTSPSAGIRVANQWGVNISYNMINNNNGGGVNHATTLRGIYAQSGTSANATISHNTLTIKSAVTTSQVSVIENGIGATAASNTVNITYNTIQDCTNDLATTGAWYGIYNNGASAANLNITNNTFTNNVSKATSGATYLIQNSGTVPGTININSNNLSCGFNGAAAYTGTIYSLYNSSGTLATNLNINSNNFSNYNFAAFTNSGSLYFIYNTNSSANVSLNSNTWTNLNLYHSGSEYLMYNSTSQQVSLNVTNNSIVTAYNRLLAAGSMYCYYSGSSSLGTSTQTFSGNNFSNITANVNGAGTFYGIYSGDGSASPYPLKTVFNNTLSNITYKGTTFYGIYMSYLGSGTSGSSIYNNTISNVVDSGATYCLYSGSTANATYATNIYGNNVNNVTSLGLTQTLYAYLLYASTPGVNFYKNKAYNLTATGTTASAFGVYTNSAYPYNIYNNLIGNISTPNTSIVAAPYLSMAGIILTAGSTINCAFNTVYLNGTSTGANFSSAAIVGYTAPTSINLQDNIFVNLSTPKGLGKTVAYARNGIAWTNYAATSNNNLFYAGTPSATNVICYDMTNSYQALTDYKSIVTPRDGNAVTENPNFLSLTGSDPTFLHINPAIATQIESGGIPSSPLSVTTDYDGDARNALTPDIGADEFAGIPLDLVPPVIAYTPLGNTPSTLGRTLTATITDPGSGVPVSGIGLPVLYWKINGGAYSGVTAASLGANQYSFAFGAGVVLNDVVSYYICAQDGALTPNVGGYPAGGSGYTANPPFATTPTPTPSTYTISDAPLGGDYTVGLLLFNKVAGKNITFSKVTKKVMKEVLVEEPVINKETKKGEIINPEPNTSSTVKSRKEMREVEEISWVPMENGKVYNGNLYVKKIENPNLNYPMNVNGIYATITAAVADLNLRGVSGVTRFLLNDATYPTETFPITVKVANINLPTAVNTVTIKPNTGVTAAVTAASAAGQIFKILSSYVTIDGSNTLAGTTRDLTIQNTSATTPQVVVFGSTGTTPIVGAGLKNCIAINGVNTSSGVIVSDGTAPGSAGYFNNITIQNNSLQLAYIALYCNAVVSSGNGTGLNITQNDINTSGANAVALAGIYLQGVDGATVTNNRVANFNTTTTYYRYGIWFATGTVNSTIINNDVGNITTSTSYYPFGIALTPGVAASNNTVSGNTVHDLSTTSSGDAVTGIYAGGASGGIVIKKNLVYNITNQYSGGYGAWGIALVSSLTASNIEVSNNMIYNVNSYGYSSPVYENSVGIFCYTGGGYNIYYNSVNLYTNQTAGQSACLLIYSSVATASSLNIRNNIFDNNLTTLSNYCVYSQSANTIFADINYNDYYAASPTNGYVGYLVANQANLAAWKIATGKDANSVSGDPKFQTASNLHIKTAEISPVSDAGTPIAGITVDYDGDVRSATTPDIGADEYVYIPPSVLDPNPFTATAINSREIDLAWALNANNDPIIIATNSTSTFGVPITSKEYFVSDPLAGGGTIIYKGTDLAFAHTLLNYATPYYYRAFSFDVSFNYSPGIDANATTALPNPPATFTATSISQTQIDLGWTRNVNNNDVIVATNSTSTFGSPVNGTVYNASDPITGGGTVIYRGPLLAFNHTGLTGSTTYFYKSWSVDGAVGYSSAGLTANATTQCAPITSFPWNESFEGVVIPAFPPCWFKENGDYVTTNNANSTYDADARTGTQFLRESWSATNEYMWTPGFELTAGTPYNFSFWWAGDGYSGWTGDVFYNTTQISTGATQLGSSFVIDGTVTTKTYAQVLHSFTPGVTGVYYFAIRVNCPTSNPWYLSFDDFSLDAATAPQLSVDPGSLAFGYVPYPGTSTTKTYSLSGSNLTTGPIVVTAPAGFEVSLDGSAWSSTVNVTYTPPTLAPTTIYAHFVPLAGGTAYSGNITNVGGGATDVKLANTNTKISNTDTKSGNTNTKSGNTKDKLAGGANVAVTGSSLLSYCVPTYLYGGSTDFMTQVTLGTLSQATASNTSPYYIDYRTTQNAIPELVQGSSNNLYITFSSDANQYNGVWIDFDHNGTFDATEFFSSNTNAGSGGTATVVITVPGGAALGQTVMRLRGGDDYQPLNTQACGASGSSYGQGQDYWVNITVPLPNDVGAYSIDFVPSTPTGAQIPKATIKNFGTAIQSVAFNTNMTIEPGGYSSTVANTPPMVSGATEQLSFASWTPTAGVLYTVKITTLLGTDANPANDTLTKWTMAFSGTWTSGATSATSDYLGSGVGYTEVVNKATTGYLFRIGGGDAGTACFKYNVNTNTWTTIASLPVVRMMNATAVVGNYVYCIGGSDGVSTTNYVSTVYKYDINNDAGGWVAVAPVPIEIAWCKAVGYNNHIYLVGGVDNPSATGVTLTSVYVYDALLNTWAAGTSLPLPRMGGAFSNAGNTLVYVGGSDDVSTVNTALRGVIDGGNPLLITWTTSLAPYPGNGREYFNSSNKSDRTSLAPVMEKNSNVRKIKSNNNSPNSTYPAGSIYRVDAAPWGTDGVIIAYGSPSWTWAPLIPNPCYVYKPATDTWVKQPDVPISTCAGYLGSVDLGGTWKLIVNGGIINGSGGRTNATQILTDILSSPLNLGLTAMLSGQCNGTTMNYTKDVTVELHNSTTPYALVESQAVTLSTSGTANPVFTLAANGTPYYIVIKSNNGLETWSATPQTFTGSALSYDFTTAATQAFGSNMLLVGTKWCIITGDANQDGSIDAADRSLCWNERNLSGIYATDFNGDGSVDAADRSIAWNNRNKGVAKPALALSPVRGAKQEINKSNAKGTFDLRLDGTNSKKVTKTK